MLFVLMTTANITKRYLGIKLIFEDTFKKAKGAVKNLFKL